MPSNDRLIKKIPKWANRDSVAGVKYDTATFVGIVKNNLDPSRAGRLQVYIPDLGGNEEEPGNWKTVNYASPFYGATFNNNQGQNNSYTDALHTYGMWMVPPDLGNQVLVVFANGDPDRGYWFACVYTGTVSHYMVPGLAAGNALDLAQTSADVKSAIKDTSTVPVTEFNESVPGSIGVNFYNNPKPPHEYQFKRLLEQGLDKDRIRGAITSSSQRESPSTVFGISTPGRFFEGVEEAFLAKLDQDQITESDFPTGPRRGGHSFVMDDGDIAGVDNLIRLRSSAGHQILMNDTARVMYISNSEGSVWLEFAENGQMHIYSAGGLNVRTAGDMNLHSDRNININAEGKINMSGVESINLETNTFVSRSLGQSTIFGAGVNIGSSGGLHLSAADKGTFKAGELSCVGGKILLNSGAATTVSEPAKLNVYTHSDASRQGAEWVQVANSLDSICTVLPTHEPWLRQTGVNRETNEAAGLEGSGVLGPADVNAGTAPQQTIGEVNCTPKGEVVKDSSGKAVTDGSGKEVRRSTAEADPGPKAAATETVKMPCPREYLTRPDVPNPPGGIGPLSQYQVKCIMAQMAFSESRFNYALRERTNGNYLGRYQVGAGAFVELNYMKRDYFDQYSTRAVRYPDAWLGTDNVKSDEDYLANKAVQEKVMYELMQRNYAALIKKADNGKQGIKPDDDLCTVAGMLCVAQLLGATGARNWRYTAAGQDANGSTGAVYFNRGRYAIDVLANGNQATAPGGSNSAAFTAKIDGLSMTEAAKQAAGMNLNPDDYFNFMRGGTGSGSRERFMQTQEAFRAAITGAAMEYKKATGRKLTVNSTIRTAEDQEKLYNAWREAGGKYPREGGPGTVNTPGFGQLSIPTKGGNTGQHGRGLAIDLQPAEVQKLIQLGLVDKYGLQFLGQVDPPHLQYPLSRTPPPRKNA